MNKLTESVLQKSIIEWLKYHKYYVLRLNSGMRTGEYRGKPWAIKLADAGTPDLMCFKRKLIRDSRVLDPVAEVVVVYFIEVKLPGKFPAMTQIDKMNELQEYGAKCFVVHSIEELEKALVV